MLGLVMFISFFTNYSSSYFSAKFGMEHIILTLWANYTLTHVSNVFNLPTFILKCSYAFDCNQVFIVVFNNSKNLIFLLLFWVHLKDIEISVQASKYYGIFFATYK